MENVISFQAHTSLVKDTSSIQRAVYFVLGFGVIVTAMADPPATTIWMAIANSIGVLLVSLAILGKRVIPVLQGSRFIRQPQVITNTIGLLIGLTVSIVAIAQPPVATIWAAYAHLVSIALVTQAIIGYEGLMQVSTPIVRGSSPNKPDDVVTEMPTLSKAA
ncbi:MAG: hypothetical protein OEZ58_01695 [Gammaproteobacteria bacterium]|nr:hypothetical protein [Gammaproteobacteria bacterium]